VNKKQITSSSQFYRVIVDTVRDFTINTEQGLYLQYANLHSFTFPIHREVDNGKLENLVLSYQTDGSYKAKILIYNLTPQEKIDLANDQLKKIQNPIITIPLLNFDINVVEVSCVETTEVINVSCSSGTCSFANSSGANCVYNIPGSGGTPPRTFTVTKIKCITAGDSGGGGDYSDGGYVNPYDGAGGDPNYPIDYPTQATPLQDYNLGISTPVGLTPADRERLNILAFYNSLNSPNRTWTNENGGAYNQIIQFLIYKNWTAESKVFAKKLVELMLEDPTITVDNIINWFLTPSEGRDGDNIVDIDNILNSLTYQPKPLPTFASFINSFPKLPYPEYPYYYKTMPASQIYPLVGGPLNNLYVADPSTYRNACAIRLSLALNRLSFFIPNNAVTRRGADVNGVALYYFIQAKSVNDFMIKTFGDTSYKLEGADANNPKKVAEFLAGKNGIYVIVNNDDTIAGYTGHADLIINGYVIGGANTTPRGGVKLIRIWVLN
jgi:hypothetical protein